MGEKTEKRKGRLKRREGFSVKWRARKMQKVYTATKEQKCLTKNTECPAALETVRQAFTPEASYSVAQIDRVCEQDPTIDTQREDISDM